MPWLPIAGSWCVMPIPVFDALFPVPWFLLCWPGRSGTHRFVEMGLSTSQGRVDSHVKETVKS